MFESISWNPYISKDDKYRPIENLIGTPKLK
jgi:hypothetical protein